MAKQDIASKRLREKEMVAQMIPCTAKSGTARKMGFVQSVRPFSTMLSPAAICAPLWKQRPFVPTVGYTVTSRKCERRFEK